MNKRFDNNGGSVRIIVGRYSLQKKAFVKMRVISMPADQFSVDWNKVKLVKRYKTVTVSNISLPYSYSYTVYQEDRYIGVLYSHDDNIYDNMIPKLKTPPKLKVVTLCLSGEQGQEGCDRSFSAFLVFKMTNCPTAATTDYIDTRGFPIFCLLIFTTELYVPGTYAKKWEAVCKNHNVTPASSYEEMLDFQSCLFGEYILKS